MIMNKQSASEGGKMSFHTNHIKEFKVAMYIRLSKEDGDKPESESITNQRSFILQYIKDHQLNLVEEYIDDGVSGTTFERPGFNRLLEDIEEGKINMVITKDLSRLGRDYIKTGFYIESYFPENNIRYVALLDHLDTFEENSSASDITPFKAVLNDMYAKDISKKIRSVCKQKRENGQYISTYPPYGYQKKEKDALSHLMVDEYAGNIVKRIFKMYVNGISSQKICTILNEENIPPPAVYLKMNLVHRSKDFYQWRPSSIQKIIKNEVYLGKLLQGKTKKLSYKSKKKIEVPRELWLVKENAHEALIDVETFEKVQKMLKRKYHTRNRNRQYLLKGVTYCRNCGNKLTFVTKAEKYKDKQYERRYVLCKSSDNDRCIRRYNNYDKLESEILTYVKNQCFFRVKSHLYEKVILQKKNEDREILKDKALQIEKYEQNIQSLHQKIEQIYEDRLNGLIDERDYIKYSRKISKRKTTNRKRNTNFKTNHGCNNKK